MCPIASLQAPRESFLSADALPLSVAIIVPVYNEACLLSWTLERLRRVASGCVVIVADGGSSDGSAALAARHFPTIVLPRPNRGAQMNAGARGLNSDVLLFLHADTSLPEGFLSHLEAALADPYTTAGCFRLRFDCPSPWLWFYSFWTRFRGRYLHFGDQAFFVRREVFDDLRGFADYPFMEDVDFLRRLRRYQRRRGQRFVVIQEPVVTSSRRFRRYGAVRQQLLNIILVTLFELGVPPRLLQRLYPLVR